MANTTLPVLDATATSRNLSAGEDAGNGSALVPKHAVVDSLGAAVFEIAALLAAARAMPVAPVIGAVPMLSNGTTLDPQIGNMDVAVLPSTVKTATWDSGDIPAYNARAATLTVDATAIVDTPSVVFTIQGKDAAGVYFDLLSSAAVVAPGQTTLDLGLGNTVTANVSANKPVPRTLRIVATHADADAITYSVGLCLHP